MYAAEQTTDLINLTFSDWEGARRAHLEGVPRSTTIGQVVGEAVRSMGLPFSTLYQAVLRGRELHPTDTLDDLGIETDAKLELFPEVSAGASLDAPLARG